MRLTAIAALLFASTALAAAQSGANWSYEGKDRTAALGQARSGVPGLFRRATSSRRSTFAAPTSTRAYSRSSSITLPGP